MGVSIVHDSAESNVNLTNNSLYCFLGKNELEVTPSGKKFPMGGAYLAL